MRVPGIAPAAVVMILLPAVCLAHSTRAPRSVHANADGTWSYTVMFHADSPTSIAALQVDFRDVAGSGMSGFYDYFCDPEIAAGDSFAIEVANYFPWTYQPEGMSRTRVSLCDNTTLPWDTTLVLPPVTTSVPDPPALAFRLWNHPNPVRGQTTFHFTLPRAGRAALRIYDVTGRLIATPFDGARDAGTGSFEWNAAADGAKLTPGVYLARIEAGGHSATQRFVITH